MKTPGTYYQVDSEGELRKIPDEGPAAARAAMMVPIKQQGRPVGVVQLMSDHTTYVPEEPRCSRASLRRWQWRAERAPAEGAAPARSGGGGGPGDGAERAQAAVLLEAVGDGIFLVDAAGHVRFWNRAAELLVGIRAEEARKRHVSEVFSDWDAIAERIPTAGSDSPARPRRSP